MKFVVKTHIIMVIEKVIFIERKMASRTETVNSVSYKLSTDFFNVHSNCEAPLYLEMAKSNERSI